MIRPLLVGHGGEVLVIPEAVSLPFEDLDLVVQALKGAGGDAVAEVGQEAGAVAIQGVDELGEMLVAQSPGLLEPGI